MTRLKLHAEPVQEAWLDDYGHLNEASYLIPFTNANWAVLDHFGIGRAYYARTGGALLPSFGLNSITAMRPPGLSDFRRLAFIAAGSAKWW